MKKTLLTSVTLLLTGICICSCLGLQAQSHLQSSPSWTVETSVIKNNIQAEAVKKTTMLIPALHMESSNCTVNVGWDILSDMGSFVYELQYSSDAVTFQTVEVVKAGSSQTACRFQFPVQAAGIGYYRLKLTGLSGEQYLGQMTDVDMKCQALNDVKVFPTTSPDIVWVETQGPKNCMIYSSRGRFMEDVRLVDTQTAIKISDFEPGIYYLIVTLDNGKTQTVKILKTEY